jgi:alkylation response protein AidB-like acyl-CoA dehydrogenase
MDFELTEAQRVVQEMVRDFAERELRPVAHVYDEKSEFPWEIVNKIGPGTSGHDFSGGTAGRAWITSVMCAGTRRLPGDGIGLTVASHNSCAAITSTWPGTKSRRGSI